MKIIYKYLIVMTPLIKKIISILIYISIYSSYLHTKDNSEFLYKISDKILAKKGNSFEVIWYYKLNNKDWKGQGDLKIFGKNYLYLVLPYMEVLIQKSLISIKYIQENQVILDYFNRTDSSNIFAVLLNEFDDFSIYESKIDNNQLVFSLIPNNEIGFDILELNADSQNYIPKSIRAISGDELEIKVEILSCSDLKKPYLLKDKILEANEIIDLRE